MMILWKRDKKMGRKSQIHIFLLLLNSLNTSNPPLCGRKQITSKITANGQFSMVSIYSSYYIFHIIMIGWSIQTGWRNQFWSQKLGTKKRTNKPL